MSEAVERVRRALLAHGHEDTITTFAAGTRTAADAAASVGCGVAQIAKSIVFRAVAGAATRAAVVVTSGANRVDKGRVAATAGVALATAGPAFVLEATGFEPGGVSPVGLLGAPLVLLDEDLMGLDPIWAAAGSPHHVFRTSAAALRRMTGGLVVAVTAAGAGG